MGKRKVGPPRHKRQQGAKPPAQAHVVICDRCRHNFRIQPQQRPLEGGGESHFFACPRCGAEYVMARITARGVELRTHMAEIRGQLRTAGGEEREKLLRQAQQIRWELEPEVTSALQG